MRASLLVLLLAPLLWAQEKRTVASILADHDLAQGPVAGLHALRATSEVVHAGGRDQGVRSTWSLDGKWLRERANGRRDLMGPDGAFITTRRIERYRPQQLTTRAAYYMFEGIATPFPLAPYVADRELHGVFTVAYATGMEVLVGPYDSNRVRALYLLNEKTHLLEQIQYEEKPGEPFVRIAFQDWRAVGKVMLPHSIGTNLRIFYEDDKEKKLVTQDAGEWEHFSQWEIDPDLSDISFRPSGLAGTSFPDGKFEVRTFATGPDPHEIAMGDLDGDGKSDIAVACAGRLVVHFGGDEARPVSIPLGEGHVRGMAIEDFDRDGRAEAICSCTVTPAERYFLVDFGKGRKPRVRTIYGAPTFLWDLEIHDLDRDGLPDLIGTGWGGTPRLDLKFNNGAGSVRVVGTPWFLDPKHEKRRGYGLSVGDIDANGLFDIAVADGQRIIIFQGDPNLSFQPHIELDKLPRPVDVLFADLDADGRDDLLVVNNHSETDLPEDLAILRNTGTGFVGSKLMKIGRGVQAVAAADFDGDGHLDAALACSLSGEVVLLRGDGKGDLSGEMRQATGRGAHRLCAGDIDGDQRPDLLVANRLGDSITLLRNLSSRRVRSLPAPGRAEEAPSFTDVEFRLEGLSDPWEFVAEYRLPLEIEDPSGIAILGSDDVHLQLVLVSDKRNDLFRLTLDRARKRLLVGPPIPLRGLAGERLDLEDVAFDPWSGNLFIPCESDNSLLRTTLFGHVISRVKTPIGHTPGDGNDGIEGAALRRCKDGTPLLYLFRERMGKTGVQPPLWCFGLKEDPFGLEQRGDAFHLPMFVVDQTAAACLGERLFVVSRLARGILEVEFDGDRFATNPRHASFARLTDDLLGLRSPTKPLFGVVEGIAVGERDLFLVVDNNREQMGIAERNAGREGRVLWFRNRATPKQRRRPEHVFAKQMLLPFTGSLGVAAVERTAEETRALAREIIARLRDGEEFDVLADLHGSKSARLKREIHVAEEGRTPAPGHYRYETVPVALARLLFALNVGEFGICEFDAIESPEGFRVVGRIE